jgi:hypothetical protein
MNIISFDQTREYVSSRLRREFRVAWPQLSIEREDTVKVVHLSCADYCVHFEKRSNEAVELSVSGEPRYPS